MRFLISAMLFVAAVASLLYGIAERTVWAPPANHSMQIQLTTNNPLVLVPNAVLKAHVGAPQIEADGNAQVFISYGSSTDVGAWIGQTNHDVLTLQNKGTELTSSSIQGADLRANPIGSDLWVDEVVGQTSAKLALDDAANASVLIASNGLDTAPRMVRLVWPIFHDLTSSNTALITGAALLLLALIINIWTYRVMRRNRGPRRRTPKPPHGPRMRRRHRRSNISTPKHGRRSTRRAFTALPAGALVVALLSGCAPMAGTNPSATPSASETSNANPPVVVAKQLARIVKNIASVAARADAAKDHDKLTPRFTGPALAVRQSHYLLQNRGSETSKIGEIFDDQITFSLPEASLAWPRSVMVVADNPDDGNLPQLLVMQQATPRSQYLVWYTIALLPGASIPAVATADVGATSVTSDTKFLKLAPADLPVAFGDVVNKGETSTQFPLFDVAKDEFYQALSTTQANQVAQLKGAKLTFKHELSNPNVISLATMDAGALVAVAMNDVTQIKPKSNASAVSVSGDEKLMLGADGSASGIKTVYADMLLFFVPALSDDKNLIRLVGATQGLISVTGL